MTTRRFEEGPAIYLVDEDSGLVFNDYWSSTDGPLESCICREHKCRVNPTKLIELGYRAGLCKVFECKKESCFTYVIEKYHTLKEPCIYLVDEDSGLEFDDFDDFFGPPARSYICREHKGRVSPTKVTDLKSSTLKCGVLGCKKEAWFTYAIEKYYCKLEP